MVDKSTRQTANALLRATLDGYGFSSSQISQLVDWANAQLHNGIQASAIPDLVETTAVWRQRFPANEEREKKGLAPLSAAEYMGLERQYKQIARKYGAPKGFADSPSDFNKWIANDVSPDEIAERWSKAADLVANAPDNTFKVLRENYGVTKGDLYAYVLNPKRTTELLQKQLSAAEIGAQAITAGFGKISKTQSEFLVEQGVSNQQAIQAFGTAKLRQGNLQKLAKLAGTGRVTRNQLTNSILGLDANATAKINGIVNQESARFGGSNTGVGIFGGGGNGQ